MRPSPQVIAMKLPMLFKSLFETEPASVVPPPIMEQEPEAAPSAQTEIPLEPPAPEAAVHRGHDPLLDCIDALGEIVLSLDAQLRAERTTNTALHLRLNHELAALRRVLQ